MYAFLSKYGQMVAFGLGLLITIGFLASVFGGLEKFTALDDEGRKGTTIFNFGLYAVMALSVIGVLVAFGFGLFQMATDPKGAVKGIAGIALIAALYFVGQSLAGPDSQEIIATRSEFAVTDAQSKIINGSIIGGLILGGLTLAAFVGSEIRNLFK